MNVLGICITWNRPKLLGRSIHCFLQQTDPNTRLFILDDAGQYQSQEHEKWSLVSTDKRYPSMGVKRNALIDMALERYPQINGFMLWDDDDGYFPHTMEYVSKALDEKCWAQPRLALEMTESGKTLKRVETFSQRGNFDRSICYGGCWAWHIDTFNQLGRFPDTNIGEDLKVAWPCLDRFGPSADSSKGNPWYYYTGSSQVAEGKNFYAIRGKQKIEKVEEIPIGWNGRNIFETPIESGIFPRPF